MNLIFFFILATFWGGSFIAIQSIVSTIPPFLGAFFRVFFALLMLLMLFSALGKPVTVPKDKRLQAWIGGLFSIALPFSFLFWGEKSIAPALAAILNGTVPIITFLMALVFAKEDERVSLEKCVGVLFGLIGVLIIFEPKLVGSGHQHELWGALSVMMMAVCYAIGGLLNRRLMRQDGVSIYGNLVQQHFSSSLFLLILSALFETMPHLQSLLHAKVVYAVFYLALFSNAIAFLIYFHLIKTWGPVRATMVTYIAPMMTLLFDWQFNHHVLKPYELFGALLILIGVLVSQSRLTSFRLSAQSS